MCNFYKKLIRPNQKISVKKNKQKEQVVSGFIFFPYKYVWGIIREKYESPNPTVAVIV